MNILNLTFAYLRARLLVTTLNIALFALGTATIIVILLFSHLVEDRLTRDVQGFDLVAGAKGSPLQLILSTIYQTDVPTGNIPLEDAQKLRRHPLVGKSIPMALGDSIHNFRIVGTESGYAEHYQAELAQGKMFAKPFETTLGADAAKTLKLKLGDTFVGNHGLSENDDIHEHFPYTVVGILKPTYSVLDRLILTPVESVWIVHEHPDADEAAQAHGKHKRELTALLITYSTPAAVGILPRIVNSASSMQAASPAFETVRLLSLLGVGVQTLRGFAYILIAVAALGIFVSLSNAMQERRYDIAVIRALGASRRKVMLQLLIEGLSVAVIGALIGVALGHLITAYFGVLIPQAHNLGLSGWLWLPQETLVIALVLCIGATAALIPAIAAYRISISEVLSKGK